MTNAWSGAYLHQRRDNIAAALCYAAETRHYKVRVHSEVNPITIRGFSTSKDWLAGFGETLEVVYLMSVEADWTRLIGFEIWDTCLPRLMHISDIISILACDGFECGYLDDVAWWYVYYEKGHAVDRFDSNPAAMILELDHSAFSPIDPRVVYFQCVQAKYWNRVALPDIVLKEYTGHIERLKPILRTNDYPMITHLYDDVEPMEGIDRIGSIATLPFIGDFNITTFFQLFESVNRSRDTAESTAYTKFLQSEITMIALEHPKLKFGVLG